MQTFYKHIMIIFQHYFQMEIYFTQWIVLFQRSWKIKLDEIFPLINRNSYKHNIILTNMPFDPHSTLKIMLCQICPSYVSFWVSLSNTPNAQIIRLYRPRYRPSSTLIQFENFKFIESWHCYENCLVRSILILYNELLSFIALGS